MSNLEIVIKNKNIILPHFSEWVETFEPWGVDDYETEEEYNQACEAYTYMCNLYEWLFRDCLSEEDAEAILFHVEQINSEDDNSKIKLI